MDHAHDLILLGGVLGLLGIAAGVLSARIGAPLLVQGWTVRQAATLLGFGRKED